MQTGLLGILTLLCLGGCTPNRQHESDVAKQIEARLGERTGTKLVIKTLTPGGRGGVICGYAEEVGGVGFPQPIPFVFRDGALTLREDDLAAFNRAQLSCGPGWVSPRDVNGVS